MESDMNLIRQLMSDLDNKELQYRVRELSRSGLGVNLHQFENDTLTERAYRESLMREIEKQDKKVILVGHSFGCAIILDALNHAPPHIKIKVTGVVLMAPLVCNWSAFNTSSSIRVKCVYSPKGDPFHDAELINKAVVFIQRYYDVEEVNTKARSVKHILSTGAYLLSSYL